MRKFIIPIMICFIFSDCQNRSNCFEGRLIIETITAKVKFVKRSDFIMIDNNGNKYIGCNYPDTLIINQDYEVQLNILNTRPEEKWIGQPCELKQSKIHQSNNFNLLTENTKILFLGGNKTTNEGKTIVNGVYITKISEDKIKYEFTSLINWKDKNDIIGEAKLLTNDNYKINNSQSKNLEAAFKFEDEKNGIEIYVTKSLQLNTSKAIIFNKSTSKFTDLMHNK